jgi:hypothetical protein
MQAQRTKAVTTASGQQGGRYSNDQLKRIAEGLIKVHQYYDIEALLNVIDECDGPEVIVNDLKQLKANYRAMCRKLKGRNIDVANQLETLSRVILIFRLA